VLPLEEKDLVMGFPVLAVDQTSPQMVEAQMVSLIWMTLIFASMEGGASFGDLLDPSNPRCSTAHEKDGIVEDVFREKGNSLKKLMEELKLFNVEFTEVLQALEDHTKRAAVTTSQERLAKLPTSQLIRELSRLFVGCRDILMRSFFRLEILKTMNQMVLDGGLQSIASTEHYFPISSSEQELMGYAKQVMRDYEHAGSDMNAYLAASTFSLINDLARRWLEAGQRIVDVHKKGWHVCKLYFLQGGLNGSTEYPTTALDKFSAYIDRASRMLERDDIVLF
jgi:hypothetical protein